MHKYNFNNPGFSLASGLFSQLVWKDSTQVGFGIASKHSKVYCVAHYWPRGNVVGQFAENVFSS